MRKDVAQTAPSSRKLQYKWPIIAYKLTELLFRIIWFSKGHGRKYFRPGYSYPGIQNCDEL